ncbi:MAG: MCE family protein [Chlamydiae bacterium]|nr:MCE family protein [Chlamydiota bacterium]MBI3265897.1 MCE family protein [Chlamydiota bacterium]
MVTGKSKIEIRVGLFVFLGLSSLCAMIIMFGFRNAKLIHNTYRLTAVFSFTNGVVTGAPVRFAGVDVGKVNAIEFAHDQTNDVYLHMDIQKGIIIRQDARLIINSLGIMGEKYLEFIPKTNTAEAYVAWDKIRGEDPLALNDVVTEALKLVGDFRTAVKDILDDRTKENIRETLQNLRNLTDEETERALTQSLKNIARLTGRETRHKLRSSFDEFGQTSSSIRTLVDSNREEIKQIVTHWAKISDALETISQSIKDSKGTLGLLISNPTIHDSLHDTLDNINQWVTTIRRHGLLYKEKDLDKGPSQAGTSENNKGYFFRRRS